MSSRFESFDEQFKSLTEVIKTLRNDKERMQRQINSKDIEEIRRDTQLHDAKIIIENLNA